MFPSSSEPKRPPLNDRDFSAFESNAINIKRPLKIAHFIRRTATLWCAFAGLLASTAALANFYEELETQIKQAAVEHLSGQHPGTEININVTPINRSLDLSTCGSEIQIRFPFANEQRLTARVSCAGPRPWSIFTTARVELYSQVVVATQPIPRNTRIRSSMLGFGRAELGSGRIDYFTQIDQVAGQTTRRSLGAQQPVAANDLAPSLLVKRGDEVILEAIRSGARISVKAIALEDGYLDEQIRVRNSQSQRELMARVMAQGRVRAN